MLIPNTKRHPNDENTEVELLPVSRPFHNYDSYVILKLVTPAAGIFRTTFDL